MISAKTLSLAAIVMTAAYVTSAHAEILIGVAGRPACDLDRDVRADIGHGKRRAALHAATVGNGRPDPDSRCGKIDVGPPVRHVVEVAVGSEGCHGNHVVVCGLSGRSALPPLPAAATVTRPLFRAYSMTERNAALSPPAMLRFTT